MEIEVLQRHFAKIGAVIDVDVLSRIYHREFLAELRRVLDEEDCTLLEVLLSDPRYTDSWAKEIGRSMGLSKAAIHYRVDRIRRKALSILRAA